jgi:hypothetical protein
VDGPGGYSKLDFKKIAKIEQGCPKFSNNIIDLVLGSHLSGGSLINKTFKHLVFASLGALGFEIHRKWKPTTNLIRRMASRRMNLISRLLETSKSMITIILLTNIMYKECRGSAFPRQSNYQEN